jgi:UDP-N-acetylmuramate--alanine ligase
MAGRHIHITGIKGTGCAALAEILCGRGDFVSGSDTTDVFYTDALLSALGITPKPFSPDNITPDISLVIYSAAYNPKEHPELLEAQRKGVPCVSYPEALGRVSEESFSAGIAGVHGKTTTTALTGVLARALDLPATVLAGGAIPAFAPEPGGLPRCVMSNGSRYFAAETCEYKKHFMFFHPRVIALTSVESDHQDFFPAFADIQRAFVDYILLLPEGRTLIFCADDPGAAETAAIAAQKRPDIEMIPYGESAPGRLLPLGRAFKVTLGTTGGGKQEFFIEGFDSPFHLFVPGKHLALNAACALGVAFVLSRDLGVSPEDFFSETTAAKLRQGFAAFTGAKRRSEVLGEVTAGGEQGRPVLFIDDYGHHPTAIAKTLAGYREFYPDRALIVDFMSHTYSRTQALFGDFVSAFDCADVVILHKIYASARENAEDFPGVSGRALYEAVKGRFDSLGKEAYYFEEPLAAEGFAEALLEKQTRTTGPGGGVFVTMGAGDNWKLGAALFERLGKGERLCKA